MIMHGDQAHSYYFGKDAFAEIEANAPIPQALHRYYSYTIGGYHAEWRCLYNVRRSTSHLATLRAKHLDCEKDQWVTPRPPLLLKASYGQRQSHVVR